MLGSACCSKNKLQQKWVNSLWQRNSQTGLQELNKWLFFSFYYQQTLVARLILREANYALKPYRLYSAPGILVPLYSIVTFCISERRSWDDNFRDTRPGCWVVWCHLWPFWNFAREKEKKKKSKTFKRIKNLSLFLRMRGTVLEALTVFPFCLAKIIKSFFSIPSKLCLHIYIWHWWAESWDFGNKCYLTIRMQAHSLPVNPTPINFILGILFQPTHRPWHLPSVGQNKLCSQTQSQRTWQLYCSCCEFWQGER